MKLTETPDLSNPTDPDLAQVTSLSVGIPEAFYPEKVGKKSVSDIDLCDFVGPRPIRQRSKIMHYPSGSGVYALICGDVPYYIGMSSNIAQRLRQHKHYFPSIFYLCDESMARELEMRLVGKYNPPANIKLRTAPDGVILNAKTEAPPPEEQMPAEHALLKGFRPIESLWADKDGLFTSKYSAQWFIARFTVDLVNAGAVAILSRKKYVHFDRFKSVMDRA